MKIKQALSQIATNTSALRRSSYFFAIMVVLFAVVAPMIQPHLSSAAQLTTREITLSDSGKSGGSITSGVGSGADVTYEVKMTLLSSANSMVIDFCSNDPIIGDSCTVPTGFTTAGVGLAGVTGGGDIEGTGWSATSANSGGAVKIAKGSGTTAGAGVQKFDLTHITNPSVNGTFYARIYTYAGTDFGAAAGTAWTGPDSATHTVGTYVDYGGVALSINQIITITARVQETLAFCVSGADTATWGTIGSVDPDCASAEAATAPALVLGHGSPTPTLNDQQIDTADAYSQVSSNATTGVSIAMRNSNTNCGGLSADGGVTCGIPPVGGHNALATLTAGAAGFGVGVHDGVAAAGGTGAMNSDPNYTYAAGTGSPITSESFGMDADTSTTPPEDAGSVTSEFGDVVAASTAPMFRVNNQYTFGATTSLTTPAGLYVANIDLIATGHF
ncbi:MAG: hypothetical protein JWN38_914 [Candidatus Saccharibacteria bacterium]|nr:hypothetical protein [Candidatus Saccharibacteria bacterium]